jgi:hypothetical protein
MNALTLSFSARCLFVLFFALSGRALASGAEAAGTSEIETKLENKAPPVTSPRTALLNRELQAEILGDRQRGLPSHARVSWALDAEFFRRTTGASDFYHGVGHWLTNRLEFRPSSSVVLNLKSIAYNGTASLGYTGASGVYHLPVLTLRSDVSGEGVATARIGDLGRVTYGAGLTIEERETNGVDASVFWPWVGVRARADGTGGYQLNGDLRYLEVVEGGSRAGLGVLTGVGEPEIPASVHAWLDWPFVLEGFTVSPALEWARRNSRDAGLLRLRLTHQSSRFFAEFVPQVRWYQEGFAKGWTDRELVTVSYDQHSVPYTNSFNIFLVDAEVLASSVRLDLNVRINDGVSLRSENEAGTFSYKDLATHRFYFYSHAVELRPFGDREDSLLLGVGNRRLQDSATAPPTISRIQGRKLIQEPHFWLSAVFRL